MAWEHYLASDPDREFILNGIWSGFKVTSIDISSDLEPVDCDNHPSSTSEANRQRVKKQLKQEIAAGHYRIAEAKPWVISPLAAIPKAGSDALRLIHDCSRPHDKSLNDYANPDSFHFDSIDMAIKHIFPHSWMGQVDIKSAYRHVGLHPS